MENKSHAILAGIFTLALLAVAIAIGMWLNRDRTAWVPYQIATKFSLPGLNSQAAVRYRGLDVGKVESISFDPQVAGQILVSINVRPDTPVTRSTFATLGYQGVTGIAYVQLDDDGSSPVRVESSEENIARIEMRPSLLDQLQTRGLEIMKQTEQVVKLARDMLSPANQQTIVNTFDKVGKAAAELETIQNQLQPTLAKLPGLTNQTQQTLSSLNNVANMLQAPNGPLTQVGNAAEQIGQAANKLEYQTLPLGNDVRSALRALNRTLDSLGERPESVLFGGPKLAPGPGEAGFGSSR